MENKKDLFELMAVREVDTTKFLPSKKEIHKSTKQFARDLIDSGLYNLQELYSQALRMKEGMTIIEGELKSSLPQENFEAFGLKGTYRNGGDSANYSDDPVYEDLKKQLADRTELLKTALKTDSDFYDNEGVLVPKVSTTPRKSSLAISF